MGDVADLSDGPFGSNLKSSHYVESGPRVVRLQNIGEGVFRDERAHITPEHFDRLAKYAVRPGDVVVASLGEEAPRACLVPGWLGPALVKADCIRARPRSELDERYLMWMLNSPPVRRQAAQMIKGVGRPRLGLGGIRALALPIPPLAEQRRIVVAIDEHQSRIDAAQEALANVRRGLEGFRRSVLQLEIGRGWPHRALGEVAETQLGKMLSAKSRTGAAPRPYLRNKNVQWWRIDVDDLLEMDFDEREAAKFDLKAGDVLVCEGGEVGRAAVWRGGVAGCCFQKALHRVRVSDALSADYLVLVLRWLAYRNELEGHVTGSTIPHLPQEDLRQLQIPLPRRDEQDRIVERVHAALEGASQLQRATSDADLSRQWVRDAILATAFRGELVPQDPDDEPASALLERIAAERAAAPAARRPRRRVPAET